MATTLILGASDKPERFSNQAQKKLMAHGYDVVLVNPKGGSIDGIQCLTRLTQVENKIDTITIYVKPTLLTDMLNDIIKIKPRRVIFNPGTESKDAANSLNQHDIKVVEHCTLIMLDSGVY